MRKLLRFVLILLATAGIIISSVALHIHWQNPDQAPPCAVSEHWDCGVVNHSRFSVFPPSPKPTWDNPNPIGGHSVPVAALGIAGYGVMFICLLFGWDELFLVTAVGGFLFALYLSSTEEFILHKWCIYCVWSQSVIATMLVLGLVLKATRRRRA
jgi:hypothetical protein